MKTIIKTIIHTTRLAALILALLALAIPSATAQENSDTGEDTPKTPIPMIVKGNKWKSLKQHFTSIEEEGKMRQYYVSYTTTSEIKEEVEMDGKKYFSFQSPNCYMREADNKVYLYDPETKSERVAFDYNLKVGEQFTAIILWPDDNMEELKGELMKIESVEIAGCPRRVFYFSCQGLFSSDMGNSLKYEYAGGAWHPNRIEIFYPSFGNYNATQTTGFVWIEGVGTLAHAVFVWPPGTKGAMPLLQLLCFTDSAGVEHDIAGIGCDIDKRTLVSAERPEGNLAASISLFDGHLRVKAADELPHTVALFALDGTPLLQETSFTGSFETQLTHHESAQPMLLLFDGKASIRLYNSPQ